MLAQIIIGGITMQSKSVCVIGGGFSGMTAAIESAEIGCDVYLIEKGPSLGGRVLQMYEYFPKLCPPQCGIEINYQRIRKNPKIKIFTLTEVKSISGRSGDFSVTIRINPRYVNENCTACGKCVMVCPVNKPNDYNYGLDSQKAIYLPHEMSFPMRYVIDENTCLKEQCAECVKVCPYDAISLRMQPKEFIIKADHIILATGWTPYDASKIEYLKYGQYKNIIRNVEMERLAAKNGPTKGKILRPSDNKEISSIAFVQCAGSRDENHLAYCSSICCLATIKQAFYVRDQYPDADIYIYYIDIRTPGRFEDLYAKAKDDKKIHFIKGKVADIAEDSSGNDLIVVAEDILAGKKITQKVNMVVLATGMAPNGINVNIDGIAYDNFGFTYSNDNKNGFSVVGCAKKPTDVADCIKMATGTAVECIQTIDEV